MSHDDTPNESSPGLAGRFFSKMNPLEIVKPIARNVRGAMERAGILEPVANEEVKAEEIAILDELEKMGKKYELTLYEKMKYSSGELVEMFSSEEDKMITGELVEGRMRKHEIRVSAENIAKERGEKIPIPADAYSLSYVVVDSKPVQDVYRAYLKGVIAEEKAKNSKNYPVFDNEHPSDVGGSKTHFQDKARAHSEEVSHGVAF